MMFKSKKIILSCVRVKIDGFRIDSWIYWILKSLVTTLHRSISHTEYCPQSLCLVMASNDGCSSPSWFTSSQGGDYHTPTSYSDVSAGFSWCFLQLLAHELS
jgi:hypothetical protein